MRAALPLSRLEIRRDRAMRRSAIGARRKWLPQEHQIEVLSVHREGWNCSGPILGPPALQPPPPALEWTDVEPPQRFVSKRLQGCNYLQAMEGGIDLSHVSWLHGSELNKDPLFKGSKGNVYNEQDRMPLFQVEEFPGGLLIGARRNADGGKYYWRITPWDRALVFDHTTARRPPVGRACLGANRRRNLLGLEHQLSPQARTDEIGDLGDAGWGRHPREICGRDIHSACQQSNTILSTGNAATRPFLHGRRWHRHAGRFYPGEHGADPGSHQRAPVRDRQRHCHDAQNIAARSESGCRRWCGAGDRPASAAGRSASIELDKGIPFTQGAKHGLYAALGTDSLSV